MDKDFRIRTLDSSLSGLILGLVIIRILIPFLARDKIFFVRESVNVGVDIQIDSFAVENSFSIYSHTPTQILVSMLVTFIFIFNI